MNLKKAKIQENTSDSTGPPSNKSESNKKIVNNAENL